MADMSGEDTQFVGTETMVPGSGASQGYSSTGACPGRVRGDERITPNGAEPGDDGQVEEAQELVASLERLEITCRSSREKVKTTAERLVSQIREHEQRLLEEIDVHQQTELKKVPVDHGILRELMEQLRNIEQPNKHRGADQFYKYTVQNSCPVEKLVTANGTALGGHSLTVEDTVGHVVVMAERDMRSRGSMMLGDMGGFSHGMLGWLASYDVPEIRSVTFVPIRCNTSFGTVEAEGLSPAVESGRRKQSASLLGSSGPTIEQLELIPERASSLQRMCSLRVSRSSSLHYGTYPSQKLGLTPSMAVVGDSGGRLRRYHSMKMPKDMHHLQTKNTWSPLTCRRTASSSPTRDIERKVTTLLWELTDVGSAPNRFNSPTDVVFLPNGDLAVADRDNERVTIINWKRGTIVRSIGQGKIRPQRLAVTPSGHLAVTDLKSSCIKIFSLDGRSVSSWGRKRFKSTFQTPCGLAINSRGQYIVSDMEKQTVSLHQPDGKFIQLLGSHAEFHSPAYVAIGRDDQVVVADNWTNTVKVYRADGELLFQLNDQAESSQLDYPNGVCVDDNGDVLVAGWGKHRISRFNATGKFVHNMLTREEGIHYPAGIATRGALIAETEYSDSHSVVRLFKIDKQDK